MKTKWYTIILLISVLLFACKSSPENADGTYTEVGDVTQTDSSTSGTGVKPSDPTGSDSTSDTKTAEQKKNEQAKKTAESEIKKAETTLAECNKSTVAKDFASEFAAAKADLTAAKNASNAGNYTQAKTQATKANTKLQTLLNLSKANETKAEITSNTFEGAAPSEYSNAEIAYIKSLDNLSKNENQALSYSKTALQNYEKVLNQGYISWTNIAMENAVKAKANCDNILASKASPTDYKAAEDLFKKAKTAQGKKNYEAAYDAYNQAAEKYTSIFDNVSSLRAEAEKAMQKATARQEISSDLAAEADIIRPLTEQDIKETGVQNIPSIDNAPTDTGLGN